MRFGRAWADSSRPILRVSRAGKARRPWRPRMAAVQGRSQRLRFRRAAELPRMRFCCKAPLAKRSHRMVREAAGSAGRVVVGGLAALSREIPEDLEGREAGPVDAAAVAADSVAVAGRYLAEGQAVAA